MKPRHTLKFEPTEPGSYMYFFSKVGDASYTNGVPVKGVNFTQTIHPQPSNSILMI